MILVVVCGALAGLGALLVVLQLATPGGSAAAALARLDADRRRARPEATLTLDRGHAAESAVLRRLGRELRSALDSRGVQLPAGLRADLSVAGRSREAHLALSLLGGASGAFGPLLVLGGLSVQVPALRGLATGGAMLVCGLVGALLPTLTITGRARTRRRDFRHVVGAFLDLVAMNLAGGRGVPEALRSASRISDSWGTVRIRDSLEMARLQGATPWAALGALGDDMGIEELRDLAAALALVADDGAKIRDSLSARAASLRRRELAEIEGRAQARSQSMLVAQLLLAAGFLIFLTYPALARVLGA